MAYRDVETSEAMSQESFRFPLGTVGKALAAVAAVSAAALTVKSSMSGAVLPRAGIAGVTQLEQMVVQGPRETCSPPWTAKSKAENVTENCINTKCCSTTGYNCFQKKPGVAGCLKGCDPGKNKWDCTMSEETLKLVDVKEIPNTRFYCFAVHTQDNGRPNHHPGPEEEVALLKEQYSRGLGVFSCPGNDVFSDAIVNIGEGYDTIKVDDTLSEFHLIKRKKSKTWVNTGLFKQVWKQIAEKGTWKDFDWVIKLDADAVFVPWRLQKVLSTQPVSWSGTYVENCEGVQYGFFGSVEVLSHTAFGKLVKNIDSCSESIKWASMHATTWGPIGEDLFAQKCMDSNGVDKIQNFDLTVDGVCPAIKKKWGGNPKSSKALKVDCAHVTAPVMHPFKTVDAWMECYEKTLSA